MKSKLEGHKYKVAKGFGSTQAIVALVESNSVVLDVGCASGYTIEILRDKKNCKCYGIEPEDYSRNSALEKGFEVNSRNAETFFNDSPVRKYDYIIFGDVLEHMASPESILVLAKEFLNDDGSCVISLPNVVSLFARLKIFVGKFEYKETGIFDRTHLKFFTIGTARNLIRSSGYEIKKELYVGPLSYHFGKKIGTLIKVRPTLLANQIVFSCQTT